MRKETTSRNKVTLLSQQTRKNRKTGILFFTFVLVITVTSTILSWRLITLKPENNKTSQAEVKQANDVTITALVSTQEIRVRAYPEKRHPSIGNWDSILDFAIIDEVNHNPILREDVHTDNAGIGNVIIPPGTIIPPGSHPVYIKGFSHLSKMYPPQDFNTISVLVDLTPYGDLIAGDTHSSNDDFINALDISTLCRSLNTNSDKNDLNNDSLVNSLDLSIQVFNIGKEGDGLQL